MPEIEVVQLTVQSDEFHFIQSAVSSSIAQHLGDLRLAIQHQISAQRWLGELGYDKVDALVEQINKLHTTLCPEIADHE